MGVRTCHEAPYKLRRQGEHQVGTYYTYRKLVDWWHGFPKSGLDFYYQQEICGPYDSEIVITRMRNYKWYLQQINLGKSYCSCIGSVFNRKLIPIIDADSENDMLMASLWLKENNIKHAIVGSSIKSSMMVGKEKTKKKVMSSNGGFWIFIDRPETRWKDTIKWINIPGQDDDYLRLSKCHRMCYLRAEMRHNYFVPVVVQESGSEFIDNFVNEIIKHYESEAVRWLWRLNSYRLGIVDISNPEFDIGLSLDEVLA